MKRDDLIILFDLDGTVIDSTEAIVESFQYALRENRYQERKKQEEITTLIGHPLRSMFAMIGVIEEDLEEVVLTYKKNYKKVANDKTFLLPNAKEAIELASKKARIGVVTTKTAQYSIDILKHLEIMHHFETLIGFENVKNLKPHPEPIFKALAEMEHKDEEVWMIGDTQMDILCAKDAKVKAYAVTSGYETEESLKKFTENIEIDVLRAVEKILDN